MLQRRSVPNLKILFSRRSLARYHRHDLSELHEMSILLAAADSFERALLLLIERRSAERVAERAHAGKDAGTLHALREAAQHAESILVVISFDFYVCCHMEGNTSIPAIFWQTAWK